MRRAVVGALMIGALTGCDNVEWGGSSFEWRPPPPKEVEEPEATEVVEEALPPLPESPVLFLAHRAANDSWFVTPIGEIGANALSPLSTDDELPGFTARYVEERLVEGREFTLFEGKTRLGRFIAASETRPDSTHCLARPSVSGIVEVLPDAANRDLFLALPSDEAGFLTREPLRSLQPDRGQSIASWRMVEEVLNQRRYRWPPDIADARAALAAVPNSGDGPAVILSTYMYRDGIRVGPAPGPAYSLFIIGENPGSGYRPTFHLYRKVEDGGKGAPRLLTRGDWDGDGHEELLLEVFGTNSRWLAALDKDTDAGTWQVAYQDACGQPS